MLLREGNEKNKMISEKNLTIQTGRPHEDRINVIWEKPYNSDREAARR